MLNWLNTLLNQLSADMTHMELPFHRRPLLPWPNRRAEPEMKSVKCPREAVEAV